MSGVEVEELDQRPADDEQVTRGEREVREARDLEPEIAEAVGEHREQRRLGGPADGQAVAADEPRGGDRREPEGAAGEHDGEVALAVAEAGPDDGEDSGCDGQRDALLPAVGEEHVRRDEDRAERGEHERRGEPLERPCPAADLPRARSGEEHGRKRAGRGERRSGAVASLEGEEPDRLHTDHRGHRGEQHVPAARHGDDRRRAEHDDREREPDGDDPALEPFEGGCERGADEAERRDELGAPEERDGDGDARDPGRQDERDRVGDERVERRCRGERRVAAGDARRDGGEACLHLAEPVPDDDACAEDERGRDRAGEHPRDGADPALLRREDEEERDPERRDGAADDREAAGAEEVESRDQAPDVHPRAAGLRARGSRGGAGGRAGGVDGRGGGGVGGAWRVVVVAAGGASVARSSAGTSRLSSRSSVSIRRSSASNRFSRSASVDIGQSSCS